MDIKRAIIASIILWVIDIIITMILFFVFFASESAYISYILDVIPPIIAVYFSSKYYFRGKKINKNTKEYLKLSILFLISGVLAYLFYSVFWGFNTIIAVTKIITAPVSLWLLRLFKLI